ncbi:MAG: helix-turn-helix transcriptional regulator [Spirochaetales bacterium]|nr:helix-turn-helix transcriptional regulator [Spirochaetales bacterium]
MSNRKRLAEIIQSKGLKLEFVAKSIGISVGSMSNKMNGKTDFKLPEVQKLMELLGLSISEAYDIFFK